MKGAVFVDVETTGINHREHRIVQLTMKTDKGTWTTLVNPERDIPEDSIEKHGITEDMIKVAPTFKDIAKRVYTLLNKSKYFVAYNASFDFTMIQQHLLLEGYEFRQKDITIIDPYMMHKHLFDNTLSSVYKFYTHKVLNNAHDSEVDVNAMVEILDKQLEYGEYIGKPLEDLPKIYSKGQHRIAGKWFYADDNDIKYFTQGKYKDKSVLEVLNLDPGYFTWMNTKIIDLTFEEIKVIEEALDVELPNSIPIENEDDDSLDFDF